MLNRPSLPNHYKKIYPLNRKYFPNCEEPLHSHSQRSLLVSPRSTRIFLNTLTPIEKKSRALLGDMTKAFARDLIDDSFAKADLDEGTFFHVWV